MKIKVRNIFVFTALLICILSFDSCDAIKAQKINSKDFEAERNSAMYEGRDMNGRQWMKEEADLTGIIISVNDSKITVNLINGTHNDQGNSPKDNSTDNEKTITLSDDVIVSQYVHGTTGKNGYENSNLAMKLSDLKIGDTIRIWYKVNSETVDRINIIKDN